MGQIYDSIVKALYSTYLIGVEVIEGHYLVQHLRSLVIVT